MCGTGALDRGCGFAKQEVASCDCFQARSTTKLDRAGANIEKSEEGLEALHELLVDAAATHADVDSVARRRLNQVFFKKLLIYPAGVGGAELTDELGQVLADKLEEDLQQAIQPKAEPPFKGSSNLDRIVEAPRFELGSADAVRGCLQA